MDVKGFVVRSKNLGNGIRLVSSYTDRLGRVDFIARVKNEDFPLSIDLFSLSRFKIIEKESEFELLKATLIEPLFPESLERFIYMSRIARHLSGRRLPPSGRLFLLLDRYLRIREHFDLAYAMFLLKFSFLEGVFPVLTGCMNCGSKRVRWFLPGRGGVVCGACGKEGIPWSRELSRIAIALAKEPFEKKKSAEIPASFVHRITRAFEAHLEASL